MYAFRVLIRVAVYAAVHRLAATTGGLVPNRCRTFIESFFTYNAHDQANRDGTFFFFLPRVRGHGVVFITEARCVEIITIVNFE